MKPTGNRLLVRVKPDVVKKGETPVAHSVMTAQVLKKGPKVKDIDLGDIVVFAPYGIDEVMVASKGGPAEKLLLVPEELVIAIYDGK